MSDKAIIIAVNPLSGNNGDVEAHIKHAEKVGKVFWHLVPTGDRDIPWPEANEEIRKGYFYISGTNKIKYKFLIEKVRRISEYKAEKLEDKVKDYILNSRQNRWDENANRYAVLITNIIKLENEIPLDAFQLVSTHQSVRRIMNYVIVFDEPIPRGL